MSIHDIGTTIYKLTLRMDRATIFIILIIFVCSTGTPETQLTFHFVKWKGGYVFFLINLRMKH